MADSLIVAKGISKSFPGVTSLSDADFDLYSGEVHALIGENSACKLIKFLYGVYPIDSGQFILGE